MRTNRALLFLCWFTVATLLIGCSLTRATNAVADIRDAQGKSIGEARFAPTGDSVSVVVAVHGLTPGPHGIHVHERALCEPPAFESAGSHFNPGGQAHHGAGNKHHAGDLPNLVVAQDGAGRLETVLTEVTLQGKGHHSLFHLGGTSIVIHRGPDDLRSEPSGNSGERIACGVIVAGDRD